MDLTTLSRAKAYLQGVTGALTNADPLLTALISRASDVATQYTGRTFQRASFSGAKLNGSGSDTLMLPQNPIISISALSVDGGAIPASTDGLSSGYVNDLKFVYLLGGSIFTRAVRNVSIDYAAGFSTSQSGFVPAGSPYTLTPVTGSSTGADGNPAPTAGPAVVDRGATINGATGVAVAVGSNLSTGQYSFGDGTYTFAAADAGKAIVVSYDFVPGSVEQAVIELAGTWMLRRNNLGVSSKALATETITYADKDLPSAVKAMLNPYRWVISP